jgi:hypothetical protein
MRLNRFYGRGRLHVMTSTIVVRAPGWAVNGKSRFRILCLEEPIGQGRESETRLRLESPDTG